MKTPIRRSQQLLLRGVPVQGGGGAFASAFMVAPAPGAPRPSALIPTALQPGPTLPPSPPPRAGGPYRDVLACGVGGVTTDFPSAEEQVPPRREGILPRGDS